MSDVIKYDQSTDMVTYQGVPKKVSLEEKSNWQKFLSYIFPWLNEKRLQVERFAEAKVKREEAEALNILADAQLKQEQARKIAIEADMLEVQKNEELEHKVFNQHDIEQKRQEIEDKLSYLFATYGLKITIEICNAELTKRITPFSNTDEKTLPTKETL
jgi:predicted RNA-binding protein Jag